MLPTLLLAPCNGWRMKSEEDRGGPKLDPQSLHPVPVPCQLSLCALLYVRSTLLQLSFFFPLLLPDLPAYKQPDSLPSRAFGLYASPLPAQLLGSVQSPYSKTQPAVFLANSRLLATFLCVDIWFVTCHLPSARRMHDLLRGTERK